MKNTIKLGLLGLTLLTVGGFGNRVFADETESSEQPVILGQSKNEGWDVPNVSLGNGLTDQQKLETLDLLGLTEKDKKGNLLIPVYNEPVIINGDDLVKYVTDVEEGTFNSGSKAFSSGVITRKKSGFGVQVIKVADATGKVNISRDESVFRNASITSGIYDAEIKIGSVVPMDGSGALAGIYKIYDEIEQPTEEEMAELQAKRDVAQNEMAVTSDIINENKDKEDFSADNLAVALADIKIELQKINDKLDKMDDTEKHQQVNSVVTKSLESNGLSEVITPQQVDAITENMVMFSNSPAISDKEMTKQLNILKDDIVKNGTDFIKGLGDKINSEETKGFFAKIWNSIKNFFSNLFGGNKDKEEVIVETTTGDEQPTETIESEEVSTDQEQETVQSNTIESAVE